MGIENLVGRSFGPPNSITRDNDSTEGSIKELNGDSSIQGHKDYNM
jgi:hypothetical protein